MKGDLRFKLLFTSKEVLLERVAHDWSVSKSKHSTLPRRMKGRKKRAGRVGFIVAGQESRVVLKKMLTKK
jgi:hypothetical protein